MTTSENSPTPDSGQATAAPSAMRRGTTPTAGSSHQTATPEQRVVETTIKPVDAGKNIVELLAARFTYFSHSSWSGMVRYGRITLNGAATGPDTQLREGDRITFDATGIEEPPVTRSCRIIHQDTDILIVEKSADLPIHPAGRYFNNTLWALLRELTGITKLHFINRLDRETSGLVLVAISKQAARDCSAQLQAHQLGKHYLALLEGPLEAPCRITGHMVRSTTDSGAFRMRLEPAETAAPERENEWAETLIQPVSGTGELTLVRATPVTGRLHQIRLAAASIGHAIVGDKLYGRDPTIYDRLRTDAMTEADRSLLRLPHQALHSSEISLIHPTTGEPVCFNSPLPDDVAALCPQAR